MPTRIAQRYVARVAARRPDTELDPKDSKTPDIEGKKIIRIWKLEPEKAAAFEVEGGTFGLLVTPKGVSELNYYARPFGPRHRIPGFWVFRERDLGAPFHEKPKWARAYSSKVGRPIPDMPYWYRQKLMIQNELPAEFDMDVEAILEGSGWQKAKDRVYGDRFVKRFGGVWVAIDEFRTFDRSIRFMPRSAPKNMARSKWDEFWEATTRSIPIKGAYAKDIEDTAQQVATKIKSFKGTPRKTDWSWARWKGLRGEEALKEWQKSVEDVIARSILRPGITPRGQSTAGIISDIVENHGMDLGVPRRLMSTVIRAILEKMARAGKIEKDKEGRRIEWWPLEK